MRSRIGLPTSRLLVFPFLRSRRRHRTLAIRAALSRRYSGAIPIRAAFSVSSGDPHTGGVRRYSGDRHTDGASRCSGRSPYAEALSPLFGRSPYGRRSPLFERSPYGRRSVIRALAIRTAFPVIRRVAIRAALPLFGAHHTRGRFSVIRSARHTDGALRHSGGRHTDGGSARHRAPGAGSSSSRQSSRGLRAFRKLIVVCHNGFLSHSGGWSVSVKFFYKLPAFSRTSAAFSAGVFALRAFAGYARGSRVFKRGRGLLAQGEHLPRHFANLPLRAVAAAQRESASAPRAFIVITRRVAAALAARSARPRSRSPSPPPSFSCQWQYHVCMVSIWRMNSCRSSSPSASMAGESRSQSRRPWRHSAGSARRTTRFCAA